MSSDKLGLVADHYQKTYELTYGLWAQRNRNFLLLLVTVALASLITYAPEQTTPLFLSWLAKALGIADQASLKRSFPFALLQGGFFAVIFYLMMNVFHRTHYILRNYGYLGELENEIRKGLEIGDAEYAFTREGKYYYRNNPWPLKMVKWTYIVILGGLLGCFFCGRVKADWANGVLVLVDLVAAILIMGYFAAYAWVSWNPKAMGKT